MKTGTLRASSLLLVLAALLALGGCHGANPGKRAEEIGALMDARARGVNGADTRTYLDTVLPSDEVLRKEEENLIRAAAGLGISDYEASAADVKEAGEGSYTAMVSQSYTVQGERRRCAYEAIFVADGGRLYYGGPAFELLQNEKVKVYYAGDNGKLAQKLLDTETEVLGHMKEQLGFEPRGFISVKLYDERDVFHQSVKLDLPNWVGGWHEYGEAIKTFAQGYSVENSSFYYMLNHETTHRMVSELSNDNAAYWLQEGLAGIYQTALSYPDEEIFTQFEAEAACTPFARQKTIDLESLSGDSVTLYYASAKAYAAFLLETYGWEKVRQALAYMTKFDLIPLTGAEKIEETNERTDEALRSVLGYADDNEFQSLFDGWKETKK